MGIRFRKSINLGGGVRLNLSKSGVGYSVGVKGARITKTANGRTRTTLSVPSTGISYVSETGTNSKNKKEASAPVATATEKPINHRGRAILYGICSVIFFLCGLVCLIESGTTGVVMLIFSIIVWLSARSHSKKAKEQRIDK